MVRNSGRQPGQPEQQSTQLVGAAAEQAAFRFLLERGLRPVRRNFRCRRGEIDLVMLDGTILVFVEVRHRTNNSFVRAALTVDRRKQGKLAAAAAMFLAVNQHFGQYSCRFDVVGVDRKSTDSKDLAIEWIRDAFRPGT